MGDVPAATKTHQRAQATKDIVKDQVKYAAAFSQDAVQSGAYLYPIKGIFYIGAHPGLLKPALKPLTLSMITSVFVFGFLFTFTYLPQAAVLSIFSGPIGFVSAFLLVLSEGGTIVMAIARLFWMGPALEDTFDRVLLLRGLTDLVSQGREINTHHHGKDIGKHLMQPLNRFSKEGLIRYLISLPLNAIPIVGTVFFIGYNGAKAGPACHSRYFQLKKFSDEQKYDYIKRRRGAYMAFGAASIALNLIPFGAILFAFSNAAGAALWASDEEQRAGAPRDMAAVPEQDKTSGGQRVKEL